MSYFKRLFFPSFEMLSSPEGIVGADLAVLLLRATLISYDATTTVADKYKTTFLNEQASKTFFLQFSPSKQKQQNFSSRTQKKGWWGEREKKLRSFLFKSRLASANRNPKLFIPFFFKNVVIMVYICTNVIVVAVAT